MMVKGQEIFKVNNTCYKHTRMNTHTHITQCSIIVASGAPREGGGVQAVRPPGAGSSLQYMNGEGTADLWLVEYQINLCQTVRWGGKEVRRKLLQVIAVHVLR